MVSAMAGREPAGTAPASNRRPGTSCRRPRRGPGCDRCRRRHGSRANRLIFATREVADVSAVEMLNQSLVGCVHRFSPFASRGYGRRMFDRSRDHCFAPHCRGRRQTGSRRRAKQQPAEHFGARRHGRQNHALLSLPLFRFSSGRPLCPRPAITHLQRRIGRPLCSGPAEPAAGESLAAEGDATTVYMCRDRQPRRTDGLAGRWAAHQHCIRWANRAIVPASQEDRRCARPARSKFFGSLPIGRGIREPSCAARTGSLGLPDSANWAILLAAVFGNASQRTSRQKCNQRLDRHAGPSPRQQPKTKARRQA